MTGVQAVSRSRRYSCALRAGEVWCWGWGAVVPGAAYVVIPPTQVPGVEDGLELSLATNRACARTSTQLLCWRRHGPEEPVDIADDVVDFWSGDYGQCTLDSAGSLTCRDRQRVDELHIPESRESEPRRA